MQSLDMTNPRYFLYYRTKENKIAICDTDSDLMGKSAPAFFIYDINNINDVSKHINLIPGKIFSAVSPAETKPANTLDFKIISAILEKAKCLGSLEPDLALKPA